MFGDKYRSVRQVALRTIINAKMLKGTLVKDYMIHMVGLFNEMEIVGVEIDGET